MGRRLAVVSVVAIVVAAAVLPLATGTGDRSIARPAQDVDGSCGALPAPEAQPLTPLPLASQPGAPLDPRTLIPLEVKIGQLIMAGVEGTTLTDDARHVIGDLHVGNVILMGRNVDSPAQVLALTRDLQGLAVAENGIPALIGTDQEGGLVQRLNSASGFTLMPDAKTIGASLCPEAIRRYGRAVGEELKAVGVNLAFAPVLDVNDNPTNPVIGSLGRSFGPTPPDVEQTAVPFMLGLHDVGVMATGKHFPGHGSTTEDSHNALPFVTKDRASLEAIELPPFQTAIDQGIDLIMPAHVTYEALDPSGLPATVSHPIQTGILREQLGFRGVIVTDDLGMEGIVALFPSGEAAVRAIEAGADMVLCVRMDLSGACAPDVIEEIHASLHEAVRSGRLSIERIDESFNRILALKARYQVGPASGDGLTRIQGTEHFRALAGVLNEVANRREEAGLP
jgi:beta-N-acetylhexosaminidase